MQRLAEQERFQKAIVDYQQKFAAERNKLATALQRNCALNACTCQWLWLPLHCIILQRMRPADSDTRNFSLYLSLSLSLSLSHLSSVLSGQKMVQTYHLSAGGGAGEVGQGRADVAGDNGPGGTVGRGAAGDGHGEVDI